jgi:threonine aldolase
MDMIDLRSDTVTVPTPEMRAAMAAAPVGDDVFGEDPTINRLQELGAARMGKEAGLLVTSGTMGNLLAILTHCNRGDEAIMGTKAHTFLFEAGGVAALGGVMPHTIPNQADGTLSLADIQGALRRADDPHCPISRLVVLENTQNRCGGVAITAEYTREVGSLAREHGLLLHLDGARIFNAAAALGVDARELAEPADSVTFCLSKGLCAPVGSVLCGSRDFITKARRIRKQLGGGMRQAGVLAAAGIIAIEKMSPRLGEDHAHARQLAAGLKDIPALIQRPGTPATNMLFIDLADGYSQSPAEVVSRLNECGVKIALAGPRVFRLVTHYWIDDAAVEKTIQVFKSVMAGEHLI